MPAADPARDLAQATDAEILREYLCIHFPHKLSRADARALAAPGVVDVLTQVIGPNVKAMQSMLFIKAEGKPGQAWHQDEDYIPTRDRSLTAVWIALDDATVENGCLWVHARLAPARSHLPDPRPGGARFDCTDRGVRLPVHRRRRRAGRGAGRHARSIFNGYLLHRSLPNTGATGCAGRSSTTT